MRTLTPSLEKGRQNSKILTVVQLSNRECVRVARNALTRSRSCATSAPST